MIGSLLNGAPATVPAVVPEEVCAKCGGKLDTDGAPVWCKSCRNKYQRDYQGARKAMMESRGYSAGISAMKAYLAGRFDALGSGSFTGYEVAGLIMKCRGPFDR